MWLLLKVNRDLNIYLQSLPYVDYHTKHPKIQSVMRPAETKPIFLDVAGKMLWELG